MDRPKFNIGDKVLFTCNDKIYRPTIILGRYWGDNPSNRSISGERDCYWYYVYDIPELVQNEPVVSIESGNSPITFKLELFERLNLVDHYIEKVTL